MRLFDYFMYANMYYIKITSKDLNMIKATSDTIKSIFGSLFQ